uniref:Pre-mRNA splicing Prp18-interacting factor n=1 Tax=Tanacetum cinerariifolium TaxID=118510 RepID=A0A699KA09_TANCI|nr:hypothetical protein [Tanacetum cinerariifolium]
MTLFNGICDNCIYGAGMPILCTECGGIVRGGLCLPCDLREKDLYNYDPNAYSFDNSNYFPQSQDDNYLCNLCGNNSHDGYDCQQQFSFVHEQEPSYNQNYDDNYYSHESPSFPCCDYCGGSHETFQCQPDNQNADFFGSDQIQTPQYPDVNPQYPEIKLKELIEYDQSTSTDRPIFLNDNEDHPVQNKESLENSPEENVVSKTNQEPPQDSNMHQLIEECSIEVPEEQKQNMEMTMLDLVKLCHHKQSKKSKIVEEQPAEGRNLAPILSTKEPKNSLRMGYEHLSITPEMESDEVMESNAKNLLPIPSECEVTSEDKKECDELVCNTFSDSQIDDDISVYDDDFEDIEYVEASFPDLEIVSIEEENSVEEENVVQREEEERLINLVENDILDNSSNDPLLEEVDLFISNNSTAPEPLDNNFDLETEVISAVMEDSDEPDEHFNPGGEIFVSTKIKDVDYFPFMFVIRIFFPYLILPEISPLLLFVESEDTIFDPGLSPGD